MARVLVIEDSTLLRQTLVKTLELFGHESLEAINGEEGISVFAQKLPDLVITDLMMPRGNGLMVIRHLRKLYPAAKIIAVSAHEDALPEAKELGANLILAKHFNRHQLQYALEELLEE